MIIRRDVLRCAAGLVAGAALVACTGVTSRDPSLRLTFLGGTDQNPDAIGNAAPVAVHIFHLAGADRFNRADVFSLIERESTTLTSDVLRSEEFVLAPGETREVQQPLTRNVRYIGIIVLFRDIDQATWRVMSPVDNGVSSALVLKTRSNIATLTKA